MAKRKKDRDRQQVEELEREDAPVEQEEPETSETDDSRERETLEKRIEELEEELADARDKHLRSAAELENFRRRTEKEKLELSGYVKAEVFRDLLGVVDDFERFFQHVESASMDLDDDFVQGVELIHKSLQKVLDRHDVERIDQTGVPVDYELHEAVMTEPVEDEEQDQTVLQVLEVGYRIGEKLVRPAKVKVGLHS